MAVTATASLTLEEFSKLPRGQERHELNEGKLIAMPPPKFLHNRIARRLFKILEAYLEKSRFGEAFQESGYILLRDPFTIRQPDVSVLSNARIGATGDDDYPLGAPELAVEIVSPSDNAEDLQVKIDQYLAAVCETGLDSIPENQTCSCVLRNAFRNDSR